jgi:hypothetical protein
MRADYVCIIYSHIYVYTNSTNSMELSPLEKPPVAQLLKNFPIFYGTRRFFTVFTRALHWFLP